MLAVQVYRIRIQKRPTRNEYGEVLEGYVFDDGLASLLPIYTDQQRSSVVGYWSALDSILEREAV